LPQHSLELAEKCGIFTLQQAKKLDVLTGCHWGQNPEKPSYIGMFSNGIIHIEDIERKLLVWHIMTYQGKEPWPGCTDPMAAKLLRKYPMYDLIVTGDNHKPFVEEYEGRLLVNPGSIFRLTAGQIEHKPRVYLWYALTNTVEPVYLPIEKDVISREHIEIVEERNNRIDAFISSFNGDWNAHTSFEDNLEEFRKVNNVEKSVMDIIYKSIEI
jgi:hypothetical protein